jgi:D-threonate/D-erythronate kinase
MPAGETASQGGEPRVNLVRIIADDLTGALDAAAPFAAARGSLPVLWGAARLAGRRGGFALDTESREAEAGALAAVLPDVAAADVAFKKIDSLLRGRTVREIALCLRSGLFASAVIAPAFPAQQRITRGGRQHWRKSPDEPWRAVDRELAGELGAEGIELRPASSARALGGRGFFLCDAEEEDDLHALVEAGRRLERPLLWIGSAGLARALAGPGRAPDLVQMPRPLLVVVGSHHPVSLGQIEALAAHRPEAVITLPLAGDAGTALSLLAGRLETHGFAALVLSVADGTGARVAAPWFEDVLGQATTRLTPPASLVVTGGATLMQLVRALGAEALDVQGELAPGIPVSVMQGGRWPGAMVVSKSGAFGDREIFARLAAR